MFNLIMYIYMSGSLCTFVYNTASEFLEDFESGATFDGYETIDSAQYGGFDVDELTSVTTQEAYDWMCSDLCDWFD